MDNLPQAFKAHALPALNEKPARSAYVFGAATPLGEAVLNQVLGNPKYTQVFVDTQAPLPATIAHLQGFDSQHFAFQCAAQQVDFFLIAKTLDPMTQVTYLPHIGTRAQVYKPLPWGGVSAIAAQMSRAIGSAALTQVRWCLIAPDEAASNASELITPYLAGAHCMVYGLGVGDRPKRESTLFQAQGTGFLDKMGADLLNLIARLAAQLANPKTGAVLTHVKTAQRLMQQFEKLNADAASIQLTPQDLVQPT